MPKYKVEILVKRLDREVYYVDTAQLANPNATEEEVRALVLDGSFPYADETECLEVYSCTHDQTTTVEE